jgi:hypothetical protein
VKALWILLFCGAANAQMSPMYAAIVPPKAPVEAAASRMECSGSAWYPLCSGRTYRMQVNNLLAAHWDAEQLMVIDDQIQPKPRQVTLNNITTARCGDWPGKTFFMINYPEGPGLVGQVGQAQGDAVFTNYDGREYIGEAWVTDPAAPTNGHMLSQGEPIITMNPIAGEEIDTPSYTISQGCGKPQGPVAFATHYWTVKWLNEWTDINKHTYYNVWVTSLVEIYPTEKVYYTYHIAAWTPQFVGGIVGIDVFIDGPAAVSGNLTVTRVGP